LDLHDSDPHRQDLSHPDPSHPDPSHLELAQLGADPAVVAAFDHLPGLPGRVARVERTHVVHWSAGGTAEISVPRGLSVCVGDWVTAVDGAVDVVLPRRSLL
jgi:hypothetical protein